MNEDTGIQDQGDTNPDDSQGATGDLDSGLFPGIDQVPTEQRQYLDPILKEIEKNANAKIQELSEQNKVWEPYQKLGIDEIDPETMQGLVTLYESMAQVEDDPTAFKEWWEGAGKQLGWMPESTKTSDPDLELDFGDDNVLSEEQIAKLVADQVQAGIAPLLQERQQMEQQAQMDEANKQVDMQLSELRKEYGDFDEKVEKAVCKLALGYDSPDALKLGMQEYIQIVNDAKGELFSKAESQPSTPERSGVPNTIPEKITDWKDAESAAVARLQQMHS